MILSVTLLLDDSMRNEEACVKVSHISKKSLWCCVIKFGTSHIPKQRLDMVQVWLA